MRQARRIIEDEQDEANRLTLSLAGLAAAVALVVAGVFLIHHLQDKGRVEDCLMAQRLNCDAYLAPHRPGSPPP